METTPPQDKGCYCAGRTMRPHSRTKCFAEYVRRRGQTADFQTDWVPQLLFQISFMCHINVTRSPRFLRPRSNNSTQRSCKSLNAPWPWSCRPPPVSPWRQSRAASRQSGRAMPLRHWGALGRNVRLLLWRILRWREERPSVYNNTFRLRGVHWPSGFQVLKTTELRKMCSFSSQYTTSSC